jgi:hypothetical protein
MQLKLAMEIIRLQTETLSANGKNYCDGGSLVWFIAADVFDILINFAA